MMCHLPVGPFEPNDPYLRVGQPPPSKCGVADGRHQRSLSKAGHNLICILNGPHAGHVLERYEGDEEVVGKSRPEPVSWVRQEEYE